MDPYQFCVKTKVAAEAIANSLHAVIRVDANRGSGKVCCGLRQITHFVRDQRLRGPVPSTSSRENSKAIRVFSECIKLKELLPAWLLMLVPTQ